MLTPFSLTANAKQDIPAKTATNSEGLTQLKAAIAEQLNFANGGPVLHKNLRTLSGSEQIDVIVHLSETPAGLQKGINELAGKRFTASQETKALQKVYAQQNHVKKEMKALKVSFEEGYSFNTVLNGFAVRVKAKDLQKLLQVDGVTLIEPDATVYAFEGEGTAAPAYGQVGAFMDTSIDFLGIKKLWAEGFEGQGIKVAVLDTGIDADHPDFKGIYKGGKNFVPHTGNDYARPRADNDASETSPLDRPENRPVYNSNGRSFYTSHGTHVAGIIAAVGNNEYGMKGIAPKVDLYAYRVLGAYGSGSMSGIIKAIDTAVEEKMDIINLSLGGGANTETDAGSFAINNAMMAGTISVIATGNTGPNRGTMGTPSTSRLGIAVGNTTNPEAHYDGEVNIKAGSYKLTKTLNLMGTTYGQDLATQLNGEFGIVAVPGIGQQTDYVGIDVNGKVALVSRGQTPFVDKIDIAKKNGAVAIIIHNNAGGTNASNPSQTFIGEEFNFIPVFDMSKTDGDSIRAALAETEGTITFGSFNKTFIAGDEVNNSSSRGPSIPNFDIKPDVSAPGTNIMSTIPMYKSDFPETSYERAYARKTGTSMATPHISGIAALIKQANPDWNAFDVKVALSNTAKLLDTKKYDVFSQGAGRVNAYAAAHPGILAYAIDEAILDESNKIVKNLKGTVTFGPQSLVKDLKVTKQILVKDMKGIGGDYDVTVNVTKSFGDAKITVDQPKFSLNSQQNLNVTLTASANSKAKVGDELLGYIHIKGGDVEVSLPFAADFSGEIPVELKDMSITETDLSFNGDGVKDEAMLYFTITGDVAANYLEIYDILNPDGGEFGDGSIGFMHSSPSLSAGAYELIVRGTYTPWGDTKATRIPDGIYTFDFIAKPKSGIPAEISDYVGPIFIKSTKPVVEGVFNEGTLTGKVTDKYIEFNETLTQYGLNYDLNEKLHASYVVSINGDNIKQLPLTLEQDGSFNITVESESFNNIAHSAKVTVVIEDAANNSTETVIFDRDAKAVKLSVTPAELKLIETHGAELTVTETTTTSDNKSTVKDVTAEAKYKVADDSIVTVSEGTVKAIKAGKTTIIVSNGNAEPVTIDVEVERAPVGAAPVPSMPPIVTPPALGGGTPEAGKPTEERPAEQKTTEEKPITPLGFKDIANTFAAKEINQLAKKGIIQGKTATEFGTNAQITRAELAVLLARALDLPLKQYEGKFGDVNASKKWAFAGVEAAARAGIVNGTTDGKFNPDAPIKREEIAAMVMRSILYQDKAKLEGIKLPIHFNDHGSIGSFAIESVYKAAAIGVIKGNNGNFNPKNNATRAEAAVMLYRGLNVLEQID
ncbi:S8 family serine peptidase [Sporosarcina sp. F6_3S_P_2]|uniref:S8 family serine peptidase n=2 Tax=Sporosarcina highlanderae TaxID=3035916 RepID=A0ABT8JLY7_9BACL|nr:S8 family serine peptidase [Sporosarcina highlanderae]MDN4605947.1 S8 family serine peptidase [Sporosarcina highlanderae]